MSPTLIGSSQVRPVGSAGFSVGLTSALVGSGLGVAVGSAGFSVGLTSALVGSGGFSVGGASVAPQEVIMTKTSSNANSLYAVFICFLLLFCLTLGAR